VGCAFDEDNQPDESEGRAQKWVEQIKGEGIAMLAVAGAGAKKKNRAPAPRMEMPLAKVVATVGPASEDLETLGKCVDAGLSVMRCNFSHATPDEFFLRRDNLRASKGGDRVNIMLDTKGPEIRMGGLKVCKETGNRKAKIEMKKGETIVLSNDPALDGASDEKNLYVGYEKLTEKLTVGTKVLLDDGLISLTVKEALGDGKVACEIVNSSEIGERKGVNLPGVITDLPPLSEKDKADIAFGIEHDIDCVAASFVRSAAGVEEIRSYIAECHKKSCPDPENTPPPMIISKIETTEALDNLEEIVEASDGIMVARGDLGVEVDIWQVTTWQKELVKLCVEKGKPVVVATQMLESMQKNPRPTRAEVADVTNAVLELADAVMLSGESANGQYPDTSVGMQTSIITHAEEWARVNDEYPMYAVDPEALGENAGLAESAVVLAEGAMTGAIVVVENGKGDLTRAISACRPDVPIVAVTPSQKVARQLMVNRGVYPICAASGADPVKLARDAGFASDSVVLLDGESKISVVA
jgi:pyruvate kinase